MNNFFKVISFVVLLFGALQHFNTHPETSTDAAKSFSQLRSPECDEDPIIVRGHACDGTGTPIGSVSVQLKQGGIVKYETSTNEYGDYCMGGVGAGTYVLRLAAEGYVTKTVDLGISAQVTRTDTLEALE